MVRRRSIRGARWSLSIVAAASLATAAMGAVPALAGGTSSASGTVAAAGRAAVMLAGLTPTTTVGASSISIDWPPSTFNSGKEVLGYIVNRQAPDGTNLVQVCAVAARYAPARTHRPLASRSTTSSSRPLSNGGGRPLPHPRR